MKWTLVGLVDDLAKMTSSHLNNLVGGTDVNYAKMQILSLHGSSLFQNSLSNFSHCNSIWMN